MLGGTTFHRGLRFSFKLGEYLPLEPETLNNLRKQFENMFVVIIGEKYAIKNCMHYVSSIFVSPTIKFLLFLYR